MTDDPSTTKPAARGPSVLTIALVGLGFLPMVIAYFSELWDKPWYRWFPLALVGALVLALRATREPLTPAVPGHRGLWLPLLGAGLLLLAAAVWFGSPWLGWVAALLALAGVLGWCGGWPLFKLILPAYALLVVMLAPPLAWDVLAVARLERLILAAVSRLLYTLSVPHLINPGGVALADLTLPRAGLFTGLYGLPGVLVAGLVWLLWRRRHPVRLAFTLLATAFLLLPGEVLRIAWGVAASDASKADFFVTSRSTLVVVGLWLLDFGWLLSLDQLLRFLTTPRRKPDSPPASPVTAVWPGARAVLGLGGPASPLAWGLAVLAILLGAAQAGLSWQRANVRAVDARPVASVLRADAAFTLSEWPDWRTFNGSNSLAQPMRFSPERGSWHRQRGDLALSVVIAGPLVGFTTPISAYQNDGWRLTGWAPVISAGGTPPPCAQAELLRDVLFRGVLWFGVMDESGRWVAPPARAGWSDASQALAAGPSRPSYLVQALAVSTRNLTLPEREEVRRRFEVAREELSRQVAEQLERKP